ncbi:MAG: phage tail protein [Epsilonproteobacteria bacterium]|nr:MAG: phage tail protein [Campylobacterota bacterium]
MPKLPLLNYRYRVEISGLVVAGFSEVSGLEQEIEVEEFKEGGSDFVHHFPKGIKHSNLILKRGLSTSDELRKWYQEVLKAISHGSAIPKSSDIYISIIGPTGEDEIRFFIKSAYPIKWSGPQLNANGSDVAIETLELVHEGLVIT